MVGIIPSGKRTFEVCGDFGASSPVEGKLYYHPVTKRLYYYSTKTTRPNPDTGYFPIWNGTAVFETDHSKKKTIRDVINTDVSSMSSAISQEVARNIVYMQKRSDAGKILKPEIGPEDNIFTQCIKGILLQMNVTMLDLIDLCGQKLPDRVLENLYLSLNKVSFMRQDKWEIWLGSVLYLTYGIEVFRGDKRLVSYRYPEDVFDTGIIRYETVLRRKDDPLKRIVKLLMVMESITKRTLKEDQYSDECTVNNLMTSINSSKPLSAQLFSRFLRMVQLTCKVTLYKNGIPVFYYKEG